MYNYPPRLCFYFTMTMYMNLYYLIVNMKLRDMKQLPNRSTSHDSSLASILKDEMWLDPL